MNKIKIYGISILVCTESLDCVIHYSAHGYEIKRQTMRSCLCKRCHNKMKAHLDSKDSFYSLKHEPKTKTKKDYAGIGAVIFIFTVLSIVIGLSIYTAWQLAYGSEDNQSNLITKFLGQRIDINSLRTNQTELNRINQTELDKTDPETRVIYVCIQVNKNSTEKVCKYWNNAELRIWFLNGLRQDDEIKQYLHDAFIKSLQDSFNKSQSQNVLNHSDKIK